MVSYSFLTVLFIGILLLTSSIKVLREYERGVIFRLGRSIGTKGPGLIFLIPIVDKMVKIPLRTVAMAWRRNSPKSLRGCCTCHRHWCGRPGARRARRNFA